MIYVMEYYISEWDVKRWYVIARNVTENVKETYPSLKPANKLLLVLLIRITRIVPFELIEMFPTKEKYLLIQQDIINAHNDVK